MKTRLSVVALLIILFIASGVCAEVVELDVWVTEPRPIYKKYHEEHAKAFMKLHPNIKVNVTLMGWTDAYVKWVSSLSAEDPPDITYMIQSWLGYLETLEMGGFLDVSDIVDKLGREYWTPESLRLWQDKNGKQLGVPGGGGFWLLHYRKDIFDKAGIKYPETWEDVMEAAKKLTFPKKNRYGIAMGGKLNWYPRRTFATVMYTHGGHLIDKNCKIVLDSPEVKEALTLFTKLFDYSPPGSVGWGYGEVMRALVSGSCAMTLTAPAAFEIALETDPELAGQIGVVVPYKKGLAKEKRVAEMPPKGWSIFKQTKHPKEAKMYVEWLHDIDFMYKMNTVYTMVGTPIYRHPDFIKRYREHPTSKAFPDVFDYLINQEKGYMLGVEECGPNTYTGKMEGERLVETMINKILIDKWSVEKAVKWAHKEAKRIYEQ